MSDAIHIPVIWEIDTIADVCAELTRLTGRDFKPDMLEATYSGELPADGCVALLDGSGGNLENARALGVEASVRWDDVAEWLRQRGYTVARGKRVYFADVLEHLQKRISPRPTAAELETWTLTGSLRAYVGMGGDYYQCNGELLANPHADERRDRLRFDSVDVDTFEPTDRWLTVEQLSQRWGKSEARVVSRLRELSHDSDICRTDIYWTNGDCPPVSLTNQAFEAAVVALERVEAVEKAQGWGPAKPTAASPEFDEDGGAYLPLFDAIKAVLGIPEGDRFELTPDGTGIYGLIERHRRDGLEIPVRTRTGEVDGRVETYYCLRDVIVWVRRELPDVRISEDAVKRLDAELRRCMGDDPERIDAWERYAIKIPALEKERAELETTTPQTPSESKYKRERLAEIDREVAALKKHGHIAEPPAQAVEPVAVEGAAKVVATPTRRKGKRGDTREDALSPFIAEAVEEWRKSHRGAWPLPADVLRVLRRKYANGSECGVIERVTEDGIEWRPPNAADSKTAGLEALRKRLERMRKRKKRNASQVRTDDMDACA